jgi:hypothetical protein
VRYKPTKKTFNLTQTKMGWWHRHAQHEPIKRDCPFCLRDMDKVVEFLDRHGLKVAGKGTNWIEITATTNLRQGPAGPTTDEVDLLFKLVTAR